MNTICDEHTMDPLPIPPLLPIKHRVLVLGKHLGLARHLGLPPLDGLQLHTLFLQRIIHDRDDLVDALEA